jgi:hypothetical protein
MDEDAHQKEDMTVCNEVTNFSNQPCFHTLLLQQGTYALGLVAGMKPFLLQTLIWH